MEKSEPTLVPEWLRNTGNMSGGGNSAQLSVLSSSNSDVSASIHHTRNRNSKSNVDFDSTRSAFLDRSSSSNSWRNSNNVFSKHAYGSFTRSQRDRDKDRDKERPSSREHWDHDSSDDLGSILTSRVEKDMLRRSHSMVTRRQMGGLHRRVPVELRNDSSSNNANGNGLLSPSGIKASNQMAVFEKDFPSLGTEERQKVPDIGRVASPGLTSAVQSLPVGSSALVGERWTSALAEVPAATESGKGDSLSAGQSSAASVLGISSAISGLNMAAALAQAPLTTSNAPQISVQMQRLEELAVRQSRQLIPVTPSMPKSSALNSSDKSKPKMVAKSGELNVAAKSVQQPSALQAANGVHTTVDGSKTSYGKLLILKQNGGPPPPKDAGSPIADSVVSSQPINSSVVESASSRSPKHSKISSVERKTTRVDVIPGFTGEKKPSMSQTQSRIDFFKSLKEKTTANTCPVLSDLTSVVSSPRSDISCGVSKELSDAAGSPSAIKDGAEANCNGGSSEELERLSEEEAAFLRSLGWEETADDNEGLTEEEINAFYQEHANLKPSLKLCQGIQQRLPEYQTSYVAGASAESSSSNFV